MEKRVPGRRMEKGKKKEGTTFIRYAKVTLKVGPKKLKFQT
jgi:hypothetical protein